MTRNFAGFITLLFCALLFSACSGNRRAPHCNLDAIDAMSKRKIYLPQANASDIDRYLKASADWQRIPKINKNKLNHSAAYNAAKSGKTVLATYNPENGNMGHIAVVESKPMGFSKKFNAYVPYAYGSVQGRPAESCLLSYQFNADKEPKMNYFIYKK